MTILVDDATKPLDNDALYPASEGAAEFRALKAKINNLFLNTGFGATFPKLIDLNGSGINAVITDGSAVDLFSMRSKITRNANATGKHTHGFICEAALANGVAVGGGGFVAGITAFATIGTGCSAGFVYALNSGLYQQTHDLNGTLIGLYVQFADRLTSGVAAPGGLGSNQYNKNTYAIYIDSFPRSSSGEYCGWKRGIYFGATSIDRDVSDANSYGIDFSGLTYISGTDPYAAYRMKAAIKMKEYQAIIWKNDDSVDMSYDASRNRLIVRGGGVERWGLDTANGQVYKNNVLQY